MSLIDSMKTACVMRTPTRSADGEGGQTTTWTDGVTFMAAIVKESTFEARIAERETGRASYKVTSDRPLVYHDVFRRESDGLLFRVTSQAIDSAPPACASFLFYQVTAEVFDE